jgi:hypothetical protein
MIKASAAFPASNFSGEGRKGLITNGAANSQQSEAIVADE